MTVTAARWSATDTITITVSGPGGYSKAYTATASAGVVTFDLSGSVLLAGGSYTYTATASSNPSIKPAVAGETVNGGAEERVSAAAGGGQSAEIHVAFAIPLQVLVTDANGNPVSGATVTYTAPAAGASASLSSASAITGQRRHGQRDRHRQREGGQLFGDGCGLGRRHGELGADQCQGDTYRCLGAGRGHSLRHRAQLRPARRNRRRIAGSFVYTPAAGTVLSAGQQTLSVIFTPTDAADYNPASGSVVLAVDQVASAVILATSSHASMLQSAITFSSTVSAPAGTPTGTVNFLDGATVLGPGTLSAGVAMFTTSSLAAGSHSITAVYGGGTNYVGATSAALAQLVIDFGVSATGSASVAGQTVTTGGIGNLHGGDCADRGDGFPDRGNSRCHRSTLWGNGGSRPIVLDAIDRDLMAAAGQYGVDGCLADVCHSCADGKCQCAGVSDGWSAAVAVGHAAAAVCGQPAAALEALWAERSRCCWCLMAGVAAVARMSGCGAGGFYGGTAEDLHRGP